ncbi:hypothetical protein [Streptomyces sp. NPDC048385]|uniref:hypothetical protein n=1 Tax=unclassified Streptomyces TaxID=2593676 RepID=UPI003419A361
MPSTLRPSHERAYRLDVGAPARAEPRHQGAGRQNSGSPSGFFRLAESEIAERIAPRRAEPDELEDQLVEQVEKVRAGRD